MKQLYLILFGMFVLTTTAQDYVRHEPFLLNDTGNIIPADFDLDGDIDVYVSGSQYDNSHIYENVGKGEFSAEFDLGDN